jgi:hypothetical protein
MLLPTLKLLRRRRNRRPKLTTSIWPNLLNVKQTLALRLKFVNLMRAQEPTRSGLPPRKLRKRKMLHTLLGRQKTRLELENARLSKCWILSPGMLSLEMVTDVEVVIEVVVGVEKDELAVDVVTEVQLVVTAVTAATVVIVSVLQEVETPPSASAMTKLSLDWGPKSILARNRST